MNVLFLTLADYKSIYVHGIYSDLLRQFIEHGDTVYMVSSYEKVNQQEEIIEEAHSMIVKVPIMKMQKTNVIKKGLSMLTVDGQFKKGIREHLRDVKFDLVIYPTPPITLLGSVKYIKKRDKATTYLLLKDIFPQNAVDIGMMRKTGIKGLIYQYFRNEEKKLYVISDYIGCMSQANVDYVIKHNPEVNPEKVEVCPNSIEVEDKSVDGNKKKKIREKYEIPLDKKVFIYGGNLGKPQGIPFLVECLKKCEDIEDAFFIIVGDGTEYAVLDNYVETEKPKNVKLMRSLPRDDYEMMVGACDVGLLFLDHRFTIPNFPSRLLSYMQAKLPVLACTDPNTDVGKVITEGGFGWWCESNNSEKFADLISTINVIETHEKGEFAFSYLKENYSVEKAFSTIMRRIDE